MNNKKSINLYGDKIVLDFVISNIRIVNENLSKYNDIAYYLEQSKAYDEGVFLLEKIVNEVPNRTVAYINLGDTYWGLGEKQKCKEAYKTYIEQMKTNDKASKIPKRVMERLK
ncbi:M48 family metallopeptidase [Aquimarina sp. RZ0]|uniref:tetratricopeptide repeat protein n=1 Tax=Aquimarina sp. RZ0 TaxID=2607730 RepID=UPI0011F2C082|nr:hypothetical protein [Aquimarina sp. RZ0]KAA1245172.1 hypothetical protein F0000_13045 [Aquimarina sp. RZ0]